MEVMASSSKPKEGSGSIETAMEKFRSGMSSFQGSITDLYAALEKEREELRIAREQLQEQKKHFDEEQKRVCAVLGDSEQVRSGLRTACKHVHLSPAHSAR